MAVLVTAMRLGLIGLEQSIPRLEHRLGRVLQHPVQIRAVRTRLYRFQPQLAVFGLEILHPQTRQVLLTLGEARLELDLFRSLWYRRFQPRWLGLRQLKLSLRRQADGSVTAAGLPPGQGKLPDWLFQPGTDYSIEDSELSWQDLQKYRTDTVQRFTRIRLGWRNDEASHRIQGRLRKAGQAAELQVQLAFDERVISAGSLPPARVYLQGQAIDLTEWVRGVLPATVSVRSGKLEYLQLWGKVRHAQLQQLTAVLALKQPDVRYHSAALAAHPDRVSDNYAFAWQQLKGQFQWFRQENGWQLEGRELVLGVAQKPWPTAPLSVKLTQQPGQPMSERWQLAMPYLHVGDVAQWLVGSQLLKHDQLSALQALHPRGELHQLQLEYRPQQALEKRLSICARLDSLSVNALDDWPEVRNLSADICGDSRQGRLKLTTHTAKLNWPRIVPEPMTLSRLAGTLHWVQTDQGWQVHSDQLQLNVPGFSTRHRLRLDWPYPRPPGKGPELDWQAWLSCNDMSQAKHYLPRVIPLKTLAWLKQAFRAGHIPSGSVRFKGRLDRPFFNDPANAFDAELDVRALDLDYAPRWPRIRGLDARVRFHNTRLDVAITQGQASGIQIQSAQVQIPRLGRQPELLLQGKAAIELQQSLTFIADSPLQPLFQPSLAIIDPEGRAGLDLKLGIPLKQPEETRVSGVVHLRDSQLAVPAADLRLEHLSGSVYFDHLGLEAKGIHGQWMEAPLDIELFPQGTRQVIQMQGILDSTRLVQRYRPDFVHWVRGALPYQVQVRIPWQSAAFVPEVQFHSTLAGTELLLPAPLGKPAAARQPLHMRLRFEAGETMPLDLSYAATGSELQAKLDLYSNQNQVYIYGGKIGLGTVAQRDGHQGISVSAQLNRLDAAAWQSWLQRARFDAETRSAGLSRLRRIRLHSDHLDGLDYSSGPVTLEMQRDKGSWNGQIQMPELAGTIRWVAEGRRTRSHLTLNLKHAHVPTLNKQGTPAPAETPDPVDWPDLSMQTEHVFWNGRDFGALELEIRQKNDTMQIEQLNLFAAQRHQLALVGEWKATRSGMVTRLRGKLDTDNLGKTLTSLGWAGQIEETQGEADFELNWNGNPYQPDIGTLNGDLSLSLNQGRLLTMGSGLGRVLGALNIDTLKRRLMLDFSDLLDKGFAYDDVRGAFEIHNGSASTRNLQVDGLAARLDLRGRIDLAFRTLDLQIGVTPRASVALPVAGAIAGGPVVGAAVLVAQQLFGEQMDSLAERQYQVSGSWSEPSIQHLKGAGGVFDKAWHGIADFP